MSSESVSVSVSLGVGDSTGEEKIRRCLRSDVIGCCIYRFIAGGGCGCMYLDVVYRCIGDLLLVL